MDALVQGFSDPYLDRNHHTHMDLPFFSTEVDTYLLSPPPFSCPNSGGDASDEGGSSDATLKLITQMLMEEDDLGDKPCMFQECVALQATEKSFYDTLGEKYPDHDNYSHNCSSESGNSIDQSNWVRDRETNERDLYTDYTFESILQSISPSNNRSGDRREKSANGKKTHNREDGEYSGDQRNKQLADSAEESDEPLEMYDKVLLCRCMNPHFHQDDQLLYLEGRKLGQNGAGKGPKEGGKGRWKKQGGGNQKEVVDLRNLLSQCAQAISSTDIRSANELLDRIRTHSSPYGDGTERLAYYFSNALEARLADTGTALYSAFTSKSISSADILRGYEVYVKSCPFNKMSNLYANRLIVKQVENSTRLHIIDFGILYGFQWPCLIQHLSVRPGGPPKLRITGIDFPQPGFRPAQRVEDTGRRLATYCERFHVPFEFNAIAKKWETIDLEDLRIDRDEVLVVNCLHRLRNVLDETVVVNSPRDAVLNLVKRINPEMFIHGVLNGTHSAPFFATRFKEAMFYFSARFDMFDATVTLEDHGRMLYEKEILGKAVMNVVACEGTERVERPETYKQWQVRNRKAGFRQLPLNEETVREVRAMVKQHYNKNFVVDEDGRWMLQGWKGRVIYALSCWKPNKD